MTHCNDQLIDQLLTQAEQEGRRLIPPKRGDPKSAPSAHRQHGCLAHAGVVCAKNTLG